MPPAQGLYKVAVRLLAEAEVSHESYTEGESAPQLTMWLLAGVLKDADLPQADVILNVIYSLL